MTTTERPRKVRSDKGTIMATQRDIECITWIAEQYAVRFDQIQRLLTRWPGAELKGKLIAETTVKDQISRWKRAGWIDYRRILADSRGYAWATRRGLALVGLDEIYTAREPASTRLPHLYGINQLRLWMDDQFDWTSERRYRAEHMEHTKGKKNISIGPIPDALIIDHKNGARIAVEVELTAKKPDILVDKLVHLVRADISGPLYNRVPAFPTIWFYVPNERMKKAVQTAITKLTDNERGRVFVAVESNLIA